MLARWIKALAGGVLVGILVQEALWALADALLWSIDLNALLLDGPRSFLLLALLVCAWLAGGAAAGLFATLMAAGRPAGYAAGVLLGLPAAAMLLLAWPQVPELAVLGLVPVLAAAPATWLGLRLLAGDRADRVPVSVITLAAHGLD